MTLIECNRLNVDEVFRMYVIRTLLCTLVRSHIFIDSYKRVTHYRVLFCILYQYREYLEVIRNWLAHENDNYDRCFAAEGTAWTVRQVFHSFRCSAQRILFQANGLTVNCHISSWCSLTFVSYITIRLSICTYKFRRFSRSQGISIRFARKKKGRTGRDSKMYIDWLENRVKRFEKSWSNIESYHLNASSFVNSSNPLFPLFFYAYLFKFGYDFILLLVILPNTVFYFATFSLCDLL